MSSKVTSFFGESLSEAVFARKTELEENIDNWYAYLFNVVEKERKELFYKMLENEGKIYPKDLVGFRSRFSDALGWLWINVFLAGDKSLTDNVSFSNTEGEDVVEFAEKGLSFNIESLVAENYKYKQLLDTLKENGKATIEYDGFNYTKRELLEAIRDNNEDIIRLQKLDIGSKKTTKKQYDELEGVKRKAGITSKPSKTRSKDKTITDEELRTKAKEKNINVDDVKRLKEITQRQRTRRGSSESDATGFINDTDFGRVYVQQRRDYIANVYTDKTEKENMLGVFDQMNKQYEEGNASPPIQKYFERRYMRKKDGVTTIGNVDLETEPPVSIGGITLAGKRKSPNPQVKNDPLRELKLYEDVRKSMGGKISDGRLRNIVKTEVVAAYNMGRLHQMFTSDTKFVRWVNDVENRTEGKVCQICTIRAMGTSESLRKFAGKESLSGIYTIEDAFTNRQLAIPSHPSCLCSYRPINDVEEKALIAAGVFQTMGETAAAAIGGIGIEGLNNTQLATDGTDRSQWWYGALAAGGTAVAIGAMMWYLRKSLVSKYAADLTKKRGVKGVETLNKRSGRLGEIPVPNQQMLDDSLRIKDDLPKIVDGVDINASNVKPEKYNKKLLKRFPELGTPLPKLEELTQDVRGEAEDLLWTNSVENVLVQRSKEAFDDSAISDNVLKIQLQEQQSSLGEMLDGLQTKYTRDNPLNPVVARSIVDTEKNLKTVNELLSKVDSRKIQLPDTPLSREEIRNIFEDLEPVKINTQGLQMNTIAGETFSTKVKEVTVDVTKRYVDGGVVDVDIARLTEMMEGLGKRQTIPFSDFQRINKQLRRIERERAFADLAVTRNNVNLFAEIQGFMQYASQDALSPNTRNIYNKNLAHKNLLREVSTRLDELKANTPTYKQKLEAGEITDRFVGEVKTSQSSTSVKNLALKKRTQSITTLEEYITLAGKKNMQDSTAESVARRLLDIVEKVEPDTVDGFVETFVSSNAKERVKLLRKYRDMLIGETRRIQNAEFSRFQQKWAMFGSPR